MTTQEIAARIAELTEDVQVGTDAGTHAHPRSWVVMERLDGSRYAVRYFAGNRLGCYPVSDAETQTSGRIRYAKSTAAARREEIKALKAKAMMPKAAS